MILTRKLSLRDEIFLPIRGRIYNNTTFANRYSLASIDMMDNPIAAIEHILRLQNWSESSLPPSVEDNLASDPGASATILTMVDASIFRIGDDIRIIDNAAEELNTIISIDTSTDKITLKTATVNTYTTAAAAKVVGLREWGKEYANNPLLNEGTIDGGFDNSNLDFLKGNTFISRQVLNEREAQSDELLRSLCFEFSTAVFQTGEGKEGINNIFQATGTLPTITLNEIKGSIGNLIEPNPAYMFAEPFVRYRKNNATNGFEKEIKITHTAESEYKVEYVTGVGDTGIAKNMWDNCRSIFLQVRQIKEPPSELTNLQWIYKDENAENRLNNWISWMLKKRIEFNVHYTRELTSGDIPKVREWFTSKHFNLNLPFQTDAVNIQCIVEDIDKDKDEDVIKLRVILLDEIPAQFNIQDIISSTVDIQDEIAAPVDIQDET